MTFTYRYAIRRPDGQLLQSAPPQGPLAGLFGMVEPKVMAWDSRDEAEMALNALRQQAATLGVGDWPGVIVQQLCTPFTTHDPAECFADEVQSWLAEQ